MPRPTHSRGFYVYFALAQHVLAVAKVNEDIKDFAVYINCCPGLSHESECEEICRVGQKAPEAVARAIFPWLWEKDSPYHWRA